MDRGQLVIYNTDDNKSRINLQLHDGTVWLTQEKLAELFETTKQNISKHIKSILTDGELDEQATVNYQLTVQTEGDRQVSRKVAYYNLDMILAIGYRVRSLRGIQFRIYASTVLKEYLTKGFAMDDDKLKEAGGGGYFKELLNRIRDIRSSEKVFYRQVLDLFATSSDYNKESPEATLFFKVVQNKMHYAVHGNTASELVYSRVDSEKDFMGLTTFKGQLPTLEEAKIAKNYLEESEVTKLNLMVSGYLDFAEIQANRERTMTMDDWVKHIDGILKVTGEEVLSHAGTISTEQKDEKVTEEHKKYKQKTLSQVERDYLESIKETYKIAKSGATQK